MPISQPSEPSRILKGLSSWRRPFEAPPLIRRAVLLLALASALASHAYAVDAWTTCTSVSARGRATAGVIGGKLYLVGGWAEWPEFNDCLEYDAAQDSWTTKTAPEDPSSRTCGGVINGKLYIVRGGWLDEYDPVLDTWTPKTGPPAIFTSAAAGVVAGKLYVIGGTSEVGSSDRCFEYNPGTDSWSEKATMPTAREEATVAAYAGKLYVFGGFAEVYLGGGLDRGKAASPPVSNYNLTAVEVYDPANDSWAPVAPLPEMRMGPTSGVLGSKIYVIGGQGPSGISGSVFEYDPAFDSWNTSHPPMPTPRRDAASGVVNGKLYIIGGYDMTNGAFSQNEALDGAAVPVAVSAFSVE